MVRGGGVGYGGGAHCIARPESRSRPPARLYWLISEESGGICWRAPEAMAEIVGRRPDLVGDYIPIVIALLGEMADEDLDHFRAGILWAIGRLGPAAEEHLATVLPEITACLDHADPQIRGMAAWCLGRCGRVELFAERDGLLADNAPVTLYEDGALKRTTVCHLARG